VVAKARLALLTISTSERRAAEIEDAYAVIVRHQGRGRRSHAAL
jgi:hypothetical protein